MGAVRLIRRLRDLIDVNTSGASPGDALVLDDDGVTWVPGAGGGGGGSSDAADIDIVDAGGYYTGTDVEAALQEIGADVGSLPDVAYVDAGDAAVASAASGALAAHVAASDPHPGYRLESAPITSSDIQDGTIAVGDLAFDPATQTELDAHVNDTSAAHAASAISADSTTLVGTGTDVQAVLEELDNGIADHIADTSAAHAASAISFAAAGGIIATDLQAAIAELDAEKAALAHSHSGADITSGTVADARIDPALARDSEVAAAYVAKSLFDANTILAADTDDTPAALTVAASRIVGRKATGGIAALTAAEVKTILSLVPGTDVQAWDLDLDAFAGLGIAADKLPYGTGSHTLGLADFTAAGRALVDDADASAQLTTLGVSTFIKTLLDDADAAAARATLGATSGAMVQLYDNIASGAIASWDVSSISQSYNHLKLVLTVRGSTAATVVSSGIRFNNDSGSNYNSQRTYSNNSGVAGSGNYAQSRLVLADCPASTSASNAAATIEIMIPSYTLTTFNKGVVFNSFAVQQTYGTNDYTWSGGGDWKSTAAIDRITILPASGNWVTGSRLTIYGIL